MNEQDRGIMVLLGNWVLQSYLGNTNSIFVDTLF